MTAPGQAQADRSNERYAYTARIGQAWHVSVAAFDDLTRKAAGDDPGRPETASVATTLVEMAQEFYTFGVSDTGEPFALPCDGRRS
jgi:hypothetical protein